MPCSPVEEEDEGSVFMTVGSSLPVSLTQPVPQREPLHCSPAGLRFSAHILQTCSRSFWRIRVCPESAHPPSSSPRLGNLGHLEGARGGGGGISRVIEDF